MIGQQEIREMPFPAKLELLETVWTEIFSEPDKLDVPQWHKDLLDEREADFEAGNEKVFELEDAWRRIERAIR